MKVSETDLQRIMRDNRNPPSPTPPQLIDLLLEMKQQRRLLCNLVRSSIFVNATDLHLWVDRGPAPVQLQYENHTRLHAGRWCFADELCQTCFLTPSKDFLDSGKCDMKTHRCVVSLTNHLSGMTPCIFCLPFVLSFPLHHSCRAMTVFRWPKS